MKLLISLNILLLPFLGIQKSSAQGEPPSYYSAVAKMNAEDYKGAVDDFTWLIENAKDTQTLIDSYFNRGYSKYFLDEYREAITDYAHVIQLAPKFQTAYYNMACLYSLLMDTTLAFFYLEKSLKINTKYSDLNIMDTDKDLDNIRFLPEFKSLLEKYFDLDEIFRFPKLFIKRPKYWRQPAAIPHN